MASNQGPEGQVVNSPIDSVLESLSSLSDSVKSKKVEYDTFKQQITEKIMQINNGIKRLKLQLTNLNGANSKIIETIDSLKQKISQSESEKAELTEQLNATKRELEELKGSNQGSQSEIDEYKRQIQELLASQERSKEEIATTKRDLDAAVSQKGEIERKIDDIKGKIQEIQSVLSTINADPQIIADLQNIIDSFSGTFSGGPPPGQPPDFSGPPPGSGQIRGTDIIPESRNQRTARQSRFGFAIGNNPNGGRKYKTKTQKGGKKYKSKMIKCAQKTKSKSRTRKQRGGFIALFKNKNPTQTTSTSGKKKSKKNKKQTATKGNDPYNF
jgi:DNA repair exonuclease SbcCD ATPase subunit